MNLSINAIRKTFIPKGNGVVRKFHRNTKAQIIFDGLAISTAAGAVGAILTKDPVTAVILTCMTKGNDALADSFYKNATKLKKEFSKILIRGRQINNSKNCSKKL